MKQPICRLFSLLLALVLCLSLIPGPVLAAEAEAPDYTGFYGYSHLTPLEQQAYEAIAQGVPLRKEFISFRENLQSEEQMHDVMEVYRRDHPECYWLSSHYEYYMDFSGLFPKYHQGLNDQAFQAAAEKLLAQVRELSSQEDQALALHDLLVKWITYDQAAANTNPNIYEGNAHTAYGALVEKQAVCDGYASAYAYLLGQLGIQSYVVTGQGGGGLHAWNLVRLDGEYFYTDVTWDDPIFQGHSEEEKPIFYGCYNLSEEDLLWNHTFDPAFQAMKPLAQSRQKMHPDLVLLQNLDAPAIAAGFRKLNEAGTEVLCRFYYTSGEDFDRWFFGGEQQILKILGVVHSYSKSIIPGEREYYLRYSFPEDPLPQLQPVYDPLRPTFPGFAQAESVQEDQVVITLNPELIPDGAQCMAALYSADGQMLTLGSTALSPGQRSATISYDACADPDPQVQLFLLDDSYVSLAPSVS